MEEGRFGEDGSGVHRGYGQGGGERRMQLVFCCSSREDTLFCSLEVVYHPYTRMKIELMVGIFLAFGMHE